DVELENGAKLENTTDTIKDIEDILDKESDVKDYMAVAGSTEDTSAMGGPSGSNEAMMFVSMQDIDNRNQSTIDFVEDIEKDIKKDLEDESDIREVVTSKEERAPEIQIDIDEEKALEHGFSPAEIAQQVDNVTRGQTATSIESESNGTFDVIVKYQDKDFETEKDLENLEIPNSEGDYTTLKDLASIDNGDGPVVINRLNQEPSEEFTVKYSSDTNLNAVGSLIEEVIDDADIEDTTSYAFTGEQELLDDAIVSLGFAFILALFFIYLVMAGQF